MKFVENITLQKISIFIYLFYVHTIAFRQNESADIFAKESAKSSACGKRYNTEMETIRSEAQGCRRRSAQHVRMRRAANRRERIDAWTHAHARTHVYTQQTAYRRNKWQWRKLLPNDRAAIIHFSLHEHMHGECRTVACGRETILSQSSTSIRNLYYLNLYEI